MLALSATRPDEHVLLRPEAKYVGNIHGNEVSVVRGHGRSREMRIRDLVYNSVIYKICLSF